jgi:acetoin utilization deacetylase AcuC-like enzyme
MAIIYHSDYLNHYQDRYHPENPSRLEAIKSKLELEGLFQDVLTPKPADVRAVENTHKSEYIKFIQNFGEGRIDYDTRSHEETYDIAMLACGGAVLATDVAFKDKKSSFALLRPPGHHAGPDYAGGFCYLNNIAIAAGSLLDRMKRIAIVDVDVHHGNGTWDIFNHRKDVLYISTHEWGIFPGTGAIDDCGKNAGEGFTVNVPFESGCGDSTYMMAFKDVVLPILSQYKPEMILVSIGVDAHYMDELSTLTLSSPGYMSLLKGLIEVAKNTCDNRISFMLEGGYNLKALAEVFSGIIGEEAGKKIDFEYSDVHDTECVGKDIVKSVVEIQSGYWKV